MNAGDVVYVLYHGDPGVYHTRILAAELEPQEWMIITPDRDIYPEVYAGVNPDIQRFWHAADGRVPRGVPAGQVYGFAPMDARHFGDLLRSGRREADNELQRRRAAPQAPPAPLPVVGAPAVHGAAPPAPAQGAVAAAGVVTTWVAMETGGAYQQGDVIATDPAPLPLGHVISGDRALVPSQGKVIAACKVAADKVAEMKFDDVRVLPVSFDAQGIRRREFNSCVALLREVSPQGGGLQLQGPASLLNVIKMIRDQGLTPTTFHEFWLRQAEISKGDRSVYEHECLSRILESMLVVDQLHVPALQSAELVVRRMQVIREAHRISPSAPDYSAADLYMGWKYRKATQGVDPGLAAHVASELKNEAAVAKEARKAREEAENRRRNPRGPKKDPSGGGGNQ